MENQSFLDTMFFQLHYNSRRRGKTAFTSALCQEIEKEKDFIILNIPSTGNILLSYTQVIKQTSYGYVGFVLPFFREFVNERLVE